MGFQCELYIRIIGCFCTEVHRIERNLWRADLVC